MTKEDLIKLIENDEHFSFKLEKLIPMFRGEQALTPRIEVLMKGNLAFWALDYNFGALYGYVAGKVDEHFYMEEDKFETIYEVSHEIASAIEPWFMNEKRTGIRPAEFTEDLDGGTGHREYLETENFLIDVWYLEGLNDFSAYVTRKASHAN